MHKTAGDLSKEALSDTSKYDAREVGESMAKDIEDALYESAHNYRDMIDEDEYCVVMVIAKDSLLCNLIRRKFYCWPYLPKPRPNQCCFLYNKKLDKITKRLWCLPCDMVMAELASLSHVAQPYQTMRSWSLAFFDGRFWEYIRNQHGINMLSEKEYLLQNREKLIDAGCNPTDLGFIEPFDFSKIQVNEFVNSENVKGI